MKKQGKFIASFPSKDLLKPSIIWPWEEIASLVSVLSSIQTRYSTQMWKFGENYHDNYKTSNMRSSQQAKQLSTSMSSISSREAFAQ